VSCQLNFLPVSNADSFVIQTDKSTIIVDIGKLNVLEDWLQENQIARINRIYITHYHSDHCPSLIVLKDFIEEFQGEIEKIHLPYRVIEMARKRVLSEENSRIGGLRLALKCISEWSSKRKVVFSPIVRDGENYSEEELKIEALHPSQDYIENHLAHTGSKLNEISIVLQIIYGDFSALLLADIEGLGLTELLSSLKINSERTGFTVNVVKIPHHGAYPANGDDLKELLTLINAEIAILSVGSKNNYGHVEPKLFRTLIELRETKRLKQFICTEVTRTCVHSSSDRSTMGNKGLSVAEKCAGEVTIIADISGSWELKVETSDHSSKVSSLAHAACIGRAELD
jgi:beta-lactamase superfamily II metal-dependent hydrolase